MNSVHVDGFCLPEFEPVRDAFVDNLVFRDEVGASVSVVLDGVPVVDLWGGYLDAARTRYWQRDSLVCVMSVTKGIASLAVLSLVDRGLIELDLPVCVYWPEFAQAGKENITVRCLLSQLAGIPVAESAAEGAAFVEGEIERALACQAPLWPPGSTPCYHSFTYGPLCQEIIRRVTGKTLGRYLREDLFEQFGIEFCLGLTEDEIARCADVIIADGVPTIDKMKDPDSLLGRAWKTMPLSQEFFQNHEFRTLEFASGSGHSNARNLARIYGVLALGGSLNGHKLVSKGVLEDAIIEQWDAVERITDRHFRYGSGFMLNNPYFKVGNNPRSFGHPGLGGANAFADPDAKLGFGYCGNYVHPIQDCGPCATALIEAAYRCL